MPERSCHHCGNPFQGKKVWLRNYQTQSNWYAFCTEVCRRNWQLEWKVKTYEYLMQEAASELASAQLEAV